MAMIRKQNFSASSGGPFSCWLNSFSSRVLPAGETRSLGRSTGRSPSSDSLRKGRNRAGAAPLPRLRLAQRGLCGRPRYHTGKVASGSLSHPQTPPAPKDKEAMRWAVHLLPCEEATGFGVSLEMLLLLPKAL